MMKHKRFCLETLTNYYNTGLISFCKNRFDFSKLKNPLTTDRWIRLYIGENTTMLHYYRYDVVMFRKDGNLLAFNLSTFKDYLAGTQNEKFKQWKEEQS